MSFLSIKDKKIFKDALILIGKHKHRFYVNIALMVIVMLIGTLNPLVFGKLIDSITEKELSKITKFISILFVIFILKLLLNILVTYYKDVLSNKITMDIKQKVMSGILDNELIDFDKEEKGSIITKLEDDIIAFVMFFNEILPIILIEFCTVLFVGIILIKINWLMAIITMLFSPIPYVIFVYFGKKIRGNTRLIKGEKDVYNTLLQEVIVGFKTIKIYNAKNHIIQHYLEKVHSINKLNLKSTKLNLKASFLTQVINFISYITVILIGVSRIIEGNLTLGELVAFNSYSSLFGSSLLKTTQINVQLQKSMESLTRLFSYSKEQEFLNELPNSIVKIETPTLKFKNVNFKYRASDTDTIENINIELRANKITAIIGLSGSGKTTIMNLIMNLYRPAKGEIFLDNIPYSKICPAQINKEIAFVTQENYFFTGTITENLILGNQEATESEVIDACIMANIHKEITMLDKGYKTVIGKDGFELSVGQKQRLSIARALVKKSRILLFDEITSSLDSSSETYIKKTMLDLSKDHTIIIVSHRTTTLEHADYFIIVDQGKIIEQGSREEIKVGINIGDYAG